MIKFLSPYTVISDLDGSPLDAGHIYFGEHGKHPEVNPVNVYWDADLQTPAAQPIRTRNGYPIRNGSPASIYLGVASYSVVIKNKNGVIVLIELKNNEQQDAYISTWSGRTQDSKNKDYITGLDIGKGDGATNDSAKFAAFEAMFSSKTVDLLGFTYVVDSLPINNTYLNGYFKVDGKLKVPNGFYNKLPQAANFLFSALSDDVEFQDPRWNLIPSATRPAAQDNALQTIAFDEINGYAYSHQNTLSGGVEHAYISRYPLWQDDGDYEAIDSMSISTIPGHQGLGVDYEGRLWGTGTDAANGAVRYKYNANAAPSDIQYFKLHPSILMEVSVSYDQKWLVTQGKLSTTDTLVRVFDLRKLIEGGPGNYSDQFSYEFIIPNFWEAGAQYVQGVASDGYFVYLLTGRFYANTNTCLHVFTFDGRLVKEVHSFNIGAKSAMDVGNSYFEAESISFAKVKPDDVYPSLITGMAFGTSEEGRVNKIYTLGYNTKHTYFPQGRVDKYVSGYLGVNTPVRLAIGNTNACAFSLQGVTKELVTSGYVSWSNVSNNGVSDLYARSSSGLQGVYVAPASGDTIYRKLGHAARTDGSFKEVFAEYVRVASGATGSITPTEKVWYTTDESGNFGAQMRLKSSGGLRINPSSTDSGATLELNIPETGYTQKWERSGSVRGGVYLSAPRTQVCALNGSELALSTASNDGSPTVQLVLANSGASFSPFTDNAMSLGLAGAKFSTIYAATGAINTSDERLKQQFRDQSAAEKAAALEIKSSICLFKFNDAVDLKGDGARWHVGVKAQQVISILESHGLDPFEYGFVCFDEWDAKEAIIEDDEITEEAIEAGSRYAVRYDELAMFIFAAI